MSLHNKICGHYTGSGAGELTGGEGRTLIAMIAGVEPEEVKGFVLVTLATCRVCGQAHLTIDKDVNKDDALHIVNHAIGLMVMSDPT